MHIPGSPRDARSATLGNDGNVGAGGNGVSASQGGTSADAGSPGGWGTFSGFSSFGPNSSGLFGGTNGIGGPNNRSSGDTNNNGLHSATSSYGVGGGGGGLSYDQAARDITAELGFAPGTYAGYQNPAGLTANLGSLFGGALSGGGQDYGGHWFGTSPNSYAGAANRGYDVGGLFGRGGVLGSGGGLGDIGARIGMTALGAVNPLAAMGVGGMFALANGANPGGVAGSMGAGMLSPIVGSALAGLGPIGQIASPLVSQAMNYVGGRAGASAYNAGYSAPASQGPGATNGFGGTGSAPGMGGSGDTQLAGLSAPEVTAPVSNPVMGPLANLFRNGGINLPLLFAAINSTRRAA